MNISENPKIAISACLLGHRVRYNGDGKADPWILNILAPFVQFMTFCPEMTMGLGAPRETLRLVYSHNKESSTRPQLIGNQSGKNLTDLALKTSQKIISELSDLDGIILKKASPTCGLERVKIYNSHGIPQANGTGIFAEELKKAFPSLPIIEEGRLTDTAQRELFLTQIFTLHAFKKRTKTLLENQPDSVIRELQLFHQQHKFLLLSHNPSIYTQLGRIAANSERLNPDQACQLYNSELRKALKTPPSPGKRINALQHLFGFFKDSVNMNEKEHFLNLLEQYRAGLKPFSAALSLLEHLSRRFDHSYILNQTIFYPFPLGLNQ